MKNKLRDVTPYLNYEDKNRYFSKPLLLIYLLSIITAATMLCCEKEKDYNLKYKVYYPGNVVTKIQKCSCVELRLTSSEGTNDLYCRKSCGGIWIESTTAPIELISVE